MQPLMGPYVYGVNRRLENFLLLSDFYFLREKSIPEADINLKKFVLFWAVYSIL